MSEAELRESLVRRFHRYRPLGDPEECWEWQGPRQRAGYGQLGSGKYGQVAAHRLAMELDGRPLSAGEHVCHTCDNPPCCNPAHLFAGTNADNAADARGKSLRVKSTCRRGHLKTPANTYVRVDARGYTERHCVTCRRVSQKKKKKAR